MKKTTKMIYCSSSKEEDCFWVHNLAMGEKSRSYPGSSLLLLTLKLKGTSFLQRKVTNKMSL